jgi:Leucine-rich repeat (LRR) protein
MDPSGNCVTGADLNNYSLGLLLPGKALSSRIRKYKNTLFKIILCLLIVFGLRENVYSQGKIIPNDPNIMIGRMDEIRNSGRNVLADFWQKTNLPYSKWTIALTINSSDHIFAGTADGGVFRSTDNGSTWTAVNSGLSNLSVYSFTVLSPGDIFAGTSAGGIFRSVNEGTTWSAVNSGIPGSIVWAITSNSSNQVFAGTFGRGVFRSNDFGSSWTACNTGITDLNIMSLVVHPAGYIFAGTSGGKIYKSTDNGNSWSLTPGSLPSKPVMCFLINSSRVMFIGIETYGVYKSTDNGDSWTQVNEGITNNTIEALAMNSLGHLYAGTGDGIFRSTNEGASWLRVSSGLANTYTYSLAANSFGYIFAGTASDIYKSTESTINIKTPILVSPINGKTFIPLSQTFNWTSVSGVTAYNIQVATDSLFNNKVHDSNSNDTLKTVTGLSNGTKYYWRVRANFAVAEGAWSSVFNFTTVAYSADDDKWDNRFIPSNSVDGGSYSVEFSGNDLYIGGYCLNAGGVPANYIAKWDGSAWSALSTGTNARIYTIASIGTDIYAGGLFTSAGGVANTNYIAKWNSVTKTWSALGTGMNGAVNALIASGGNIYAAGSFTKAGGVTVNYVAKWDGSSWSALGTGMNSYAVSLAAGSGGEIYAGGGFITAGGVSANSIAKWNGSSWSALGSGVDNYVWAITCSGNNVYAGGDFTAAGGLPVSHIAKWDGSSWSALGSGVNDRVTAATANGSDIYFGGWFDNAGGIENTSHIAKWNGSAWFSLGSGVNDRVFDIYIKDGDVWACGNFTIAGGKLSNYLGRYGSPVTTTIGTPNLITPADKSLNISTSPVLTWSKVSAATSYHLQVSTDANFSSIFYIDSAISDTSRQIRGLDGNSKYYWKVRAKNSNAIGSWSQVYLFTTAGNLPIVSDPVVVSVTSNTATLSANVTSGGGLSLTERGIAWGTNANPTIADGFIKDNLTTLGSFSVIISSGFMPNTTYHFRGYATNSNGTGYSSDNTFTTSAAPPAVVTLSATNLTTSSAHLNGTVNPNGTSVIVSFEYGLTTAYGTSIKAAPSVMSGSQIQNAAADLSGLTPNTTYHYRIIASGNAGSSNGNDMTFTTPGLVPVVINPTISNITMSSAILGGTVSSSNGSLIMERGIVYSTTPNPTWESASTKTASGDLGAFSVLVSGLKANTVYYFRAYARNEAGFGYTNDSSFKTNSTEPVVTTLPASKITKNSAVLNGKVNANGLATSIQFEYGKTTDYGNTLPGNPGTYDGIIDSNFYAGISGLDLKTTYHFRITATNATGTSLGQDLTFTTLDSQDVKVIFKDPNLENEVRKTLNILSGDLTVGNLKSLTSLSADGKNISYLSGLEHAINLKILNLFNNNISNTDTLAFLNALTNLNIGKNKISDISNLNKLVNITELLLPENLISDLSGLSKLKKLVNLDLGSNNITGLSGLADLASLEILDLNNNHITDISGLTNLTNLIYLALNDNSINNLTYLNKLGKLKELYLSRNNISDINALSGLKTLTILDLGENIITDIQAVSNLTLLTDILLQKNKLNDTDLPYLYPLKLLSNQNTDVYINSQPQKGYLDLRGNIGFTSNAIKLLDEQLPLIDSQHILWDTLSAPGVVKFYDSKLEAAIRSKLNKPSGDIYESDMLTITTLDLGNKGIKDLTGLEYTKNLISLDAGSNSINDVTSIKNLVQLQTLYINNNQIADINQLKDLINLTDLKIYRNKIGNISILSNLINLEKLDANHNEISDLSSLSNLVKIKQLDISNNQISEIGALTSLINLTSLSLGYNSIVNIDALSGLINLEYLLIASNQISDIKSLKNLTKIKILDLNANKIADISPLIKLTALGVLSLSDNRISDISVLGGNSSLGTLYLRGNQISNISALANLKNLIVLVLDSNQITDISPLKYLNSLLQLFLGNNKISDITTLENLNLLDLSIRNNLLDDNDLPGLYNLKNLVNTGVWTYLGIDTVNGYLDLRGNLGFTLIAIKNLDSQLPLIDLAHILFDTLNLGGAPKITMADTIKVFEESVWLTAITNPNGKSTTCWFEYGTKSDLSVYDSTKKINIGSDTLPHILKDTIDGLIQATKYYYRAAAQNSEGQIKSAISSFITAAKQISAKINLSASSLSFPANRNGTLPAAKVINISNGGGGQLVWSMEKNVAWLDITPSTGTNTQAVTISVNTSNLSVGKNNGIITVKATGASNTPQTINVEYEIFNIMVPKAVISTGSDLALSGQDKNITFTLVNGVVPNSVTAFYRAGGSPVFDSVLVTSSNNIYSFSIPKEKITERGIDYYLKSYFDGLQAQITRDDGKLFPVRVKISVIDTTIPLSKSKYSLATAIEFDGTTLFNEIEREIGGQSKELWRVLKWKTDKYEEYSIDNSFTLNNGDGFWFITGSDKKTISLKNLLTTPSNEPYKIILEPGWNQIGNPFLFPVSTGNIIKTTNKNIDKLWLWNTQTGNYLPEETAIKKWTGYFIRNLENDTASILINPVAYSYTSALKKESKIKNYGEWKISINIFNEEGIKNSIPLNNIPLEIGCLIDASEEWDNNDFGAPPRKPENSIKEPVMFISNTDWNKYAGKYIRDYKPADGKGRIWNLALDNIENLSNALFMTMEVDGFIPDDYSIIIYDIERKTESKYNLSGMIGNKITLKLNTAGNVSSKKYRITTGDEKFISKDSENFPESYLLYQNYPNPFNPSTRIQYFIPNDDYIELIIYNSLGQQIEKLIGMNQKKGIYSVDWNPKELPSGIYMYQLRSRSYQDMKKMLYLR